MQALLKNRKANAAMGMKRWRGEVLQGCLLLFIGAIGGLLARSVDIPGGAVVGSLLAVGIFYVVRGKASTEKNPWQKRFGRVGRLVLGTVVGSAFSADVIAPLKVAVLPMVAVVAIVTAIALAMGWVLYRFGKVDFGTAIIGAVPGGLPAMVGIAADMKADATVVAAIHVARLTSVLLVVPSVLPWLVAASHGAVSVAPVAGGSDSIAFWHSVMTLAIGTTAGLLAARLGVPSGDLMGPLVVVGTANVLGAGLGPLSDNLRQLAMIFIGAAVGTQFSKESFSRMKRVALPAAVGIATLIAAGLALGWGLSLITPIDLATALVSCAPGGASMLAGIATDLGADMRVVAALQMVRQLVVFILVPVVVERVLRGRQPRERGAGRPMPGAPPAIRSE